MRNVSGSPRHPVTDSMDRLTCITITFALILGLAAPAWSALVVDAIVLYDPSRPERAIGAVGVYDTANTGPLPLVVLGHATATPVSHYLSLAGDLAASGLLVVLPDTEPGFTGDQDALAHDMVAVARAVLDRQPEVPGAWPQPSGRWALAGHSLGGGAAVLAATRSQPDALVLMAPQERARPSMIAVADQVMAPVLLLSGTLDCITPPQDHHDPLFQALGATPRVLASLLGGGHCGFAAPCEPCTGAESGCPPLLEADIMQDLALELASPWLRWHLLDDPTGQPAFEAALDQPLISAEVALGVTPVPAEIRWRLRSLSASPGVPTSRWRLLGPAMDRPVTARIYDLRGRRVSSARMTPVAGGLDLFWDGRDAAAGVYVLRVTVGRTVLTAKTVRLP